MDPIDLYYHCCYYRDLQQIGKPLTRSEVGNRAVVITQKELEKLEELGGWLIIVRSKGEITDIDPEVTGYGPNDRHIIFPEELGELPKDQTP